MTIFAERLIFYKNIVAYRTTLTTLQENWIVRWAFFWMMLTIMIILLAWDDEGITLKLHSHGRLLARCLARNLQWEGVCSEVWNQTYTVYIWKWNVFLPEIRWRKPSLGFGPVFCPKLSEDQKKVFVQVVIEFCDRILFKSRVKVVTFSLLMPMGGYFRFLRKNWSQKVIKTGYFAYFACQIPRPIWLRYCFQLLESAFCLLILPQLLLFLSLSIWERKKAKCRFSQLKVARVNAASDIFYSRP